MRHRIGTFNERSLRYCIAEREYYVPADREAQDVYREHMERSFDVYQRLLEAGWHREQARGVLGAAIYTEFIWTVNAWSLMNWLSKRYHKSAQWEHRQYADVILGLFKEVMPVTASSFEEHVLKP